MVAISLYKGNLHKASEVPHRWPMPCRKLTLRDFKILHRRRLNALALLKSSRTADADIATTANPNLGLGSGPPGDGNNNVKDYDKNDSGPKADLGELDSGGQILAPRKDLKEGEDKKENDGEVRGEKALEGGDCLGNLIKESDALVEEKNGNIVETEDKAKVPVHPESEAQNKKNDVIDKEKRKKEVEAKLEILNEKKHSLVQVLKQILNAEEELKRQSSLQGMAGRQFPPLLVDTTDSGSMSRLNTPRTGSDGNVGGDMDAGEADDAWNHNARSCNVLRLSSTSPSSDSQTRKTASTALVSHASRATAGVAGSPSRFARTGQQGQSSNPPSVSVSGTNYIASSPSPAASGGTSVFRDGRLPSPWN